MKEKKSSKIDNKKNRSDIFKDYFEVIVKIVYTLNLISDKNDMSRRLSSNFDRGFTYEEDIISDDKNNNISELEFLQKSLNADIKKALSFKKYNFNIDRFIEEEGLSLDERLILYSILTYTIYGDSMSSISIRRLLELITIDGDIYINKYHYFDSESKLVSSGILALSQEPYPTVGIFEISNTLVSFSNTKIVFSFLEKESYDTFLYVRDTLLNSFEEEQVEISTSNKKSKKQNNILTPKEIVSELNKLVIGQEEAKRTLAVHGYMHCLRVSGNINVPFRSNIMMIGSTGVGKTYLVKSLADILGLPFARADVTTLTETGYVGDDVEMVLYNLYRKANGNLDRAKYGIVFLDEVDKIAKADAHQSTTGNPSDKAVQEALLSMLNGEDIRIPEFGDRRMMHFNNGIVMNTKNILFIFGGAFVGLDEIIKMRLKGESSLGFGSNAVINKLNKDRILSQVDVKDIEKFGMIPEFIGRIPIVVTLNDLTKDNLKDILLKAQDSPILKYYIFFESIGKKLVFTDDAIDFIASRAVGMNMGARSLKSIVETSMVNVLFNLDGIKSNTLTLTKKDLEKIFEERDNSIAESIDNRNKIDTKNNKDNKKYMA